VGWTWASVGQLGDVQLGRQRSPRNVSKNNPTKYIRAANITERGIDVTDVLEMEFSPEERERFVLRNGDIVLSEASGSPSQVGKPAVWREELPLCCFQNTVLRLRPAVLGPKYVVVAFQHLYANSVFAKVASGVGINHLGAQKFSAIPFPLPPLPEQTRIVAEVERRLSVVAELEPVVSVNLQRATRLRQSIWVLENGTEWQLPQHVLGGRVGFADEGIQFTELGEENERIGNAFQDCLMQVIRSQGVARSVRDVVVELIRNALTHGRATECLVQIKKGGIYVFDNGSDFSFVDLERHKQGRGGAAAIRYVVEHCAGEVVVGSKRQNNLNETMLARAGGLSGCFLHSLAVFSSSGRIGS
jgi:Type I restriction modification DNA specificity domain